MSLWECRVRALWFIQILTEWSLQAWVGTRHGGDSSRVIQTAFLGLLAEKEMQKISALTEAACRAAMASSKECKGLDGDVGIGAQTQMGKDKECRLCSWISMSLRPA